MKHQLEPVFHFLCSFKAFVRVSCFSTSRRKMGGCGRVQPQRQVGKQSGCARHKTGGGPTAEALRKKVGARLQRSLMGLFLFFFFFNLQSAFTSARGGRQQGDGGTKYNIGFNATFPEGLFHIYMTLRKPVENVQKRGRPRDWTSLLSVTFKLTFEKRSHILKKIIHFFKSIKHLPS